jgi:hypothetical protein
MRPSPALIERFASALVRRLSEAPFVELKASEKAVHDRIVGLLNENFAQEVAIEEEARAQADALVRKGAPGVRREDLDPRRVEQLMKQRIAKERGFVL